MIRSCLILLVSMLLSAPAVLAQSVRGRVLDARSGEVIPGASVEVRRTDGAFAGRARAAADGTFLVPLADGGDFEITARQDGYAPMQAVPIHVGAEEVVHIDVRLARDVVQLDALTVVARRREIRHDASYEGAVARHAYLPTIGNSRVLLRSDPEYRTAMGITDLFQWLPAPRSCLIVFWNGSPLSLPGEGTALEWLEPYSARQFEAVEFYRSYHDAPAGLRQLPANVGMPTGCSVLALWPRQDGGGLLADDGEGGRWSRLLLAGGATAVAILLAIWFGR